MKMLVHTILFLLLSQTVWAAQKEAALTPLPLSPRQVNAVVCKSKGAANTVAAEIQTRGSVGVVGADCAFVVLPSDFRSPSAIASENAEIHGSEPASDGRRLLIYELSSGHERNKEGTAIFLVLLPET